MKARVSPSDNSIATKLPTPPYGHSQNSCVTYSFVRHPLALFVKRERQREKNRERQRVRERERNIREMQKREREMRVNDYKAVLIVNAEI